MRIAFLGWGSLIWNPRGLRIQGGWQADGPRIPIEFARISANGSLTLVICPECPSVNEVATLWAVADHKDFKEAMDNLRDREGTSPGRIGCLLMGHLPEGCPGQIPRWTASKGPNATAWERVLGSVGDRGNHRETLPEESLERVRRWAIAGQIDAVVWTDLPSNWSEPPPKFVGMVKGAFCAEEVIAYLRRLGTQCSDQASEAERYVRFAPEQVQTPIRRRIEEEFGWRFIPEEDRMDFWPTGVTGP